MTNQNKPDCKHEKTIPQFNEQAAKGLSAQEVRRRWPRFQGNCPDCGGSVISYASFMHYGLGDW